MHMGAFTLSPLCKGVLRSSLVFCHRTFWDNLSHPVFYGQAAQKWWTDICPKTTVTINVRCANPQQRNLRPQTSTFAQYGMYAHEDEVIGVWRKLSNDGA